MKTKNKARMAAAMMCGCFAFAAAANATIITLQVDPNLPPGTTTAVLGAVNPGTPANAASVVTYINGIIPLALGGSATVGSDTVYRSGNSLAALGAASLPTATLTGSGNEGSSDSFTISSGFTYLTGKYDGPNGGTEVWYIGNIAAGTTIDIPSNAFGKNNDQYGLSTVYLFNPTGSVPDSGSTWVLLGVALVCMGAAKWKLRSGSGLPIT
jgi:hypothetical protein